jgi:uncharacterized protein YndB with AHSA1/START domain
MNKNLAYDFTVNNEDKTILVKREFAANVPLVWSAYTQSEILDQWWAPHPWKARTKTMDFREGGQWLYAMVGPNNEEHWSVANYKRIVPQQEFAVRDGFTDAEGTINTEMPQSDWNVSFSEKGDHTLVEILISYKELSQLEETIKMGFKEGLAMGMENLDALLPSLLK